MEFYMECPRGVIKVPDSDNYLYCFNEFMKSDWEIFEEHLSLGKLLMEFGIMINIRYIQCKGDNWRAITIKERKLQHLVGRQFSGFIEDFVNNEKMPHIQLTEVKPDVFKIELFNIDEGFIDTSCVCLKSIIYKIDRAILSKRFKTHCLWEARTTL